MRLMTLDLSAIVGYGFGNPFGNGGPPFSGTYKLVGDDATDRCYNLFMWARDKFEANEITDVVIELPFIPKGATSFAANASLIGYSMAAGMAAKASRAKCSGVHQQTWRSGLKLPSQGPKSVLAHPDYAHFASRKTGLKDAKRQWVKDRTIDYVTKRGCTPKDDNEADACAIYFWKADRLLQKLEGTSTRKDLFDDLKV